VVADVSDNGSRDARHKRVQGRVSK
jgi:hypothetical protein